MSSSQASQNWQGRCNPPAKTRSLSLARRVLDLRQDITHLIAFILVISQNLDVQVSPEVKVELFWSLCRGGTGEILGQKGRNRRVGHVRFHWSAGHPYCPRRDSKDGRASVWGSSSCLWVPTRSWFPPPWYCYAQCPNPRAGREKASKTMQLAKREVYCWLESGLLLHPTQWCGVREPQAQAVTQIYRVSTCRW